MKKNILLKDGWKLTECNEWFLNQYRGLAIRTFMKTNSFKTSGSQITEDEKQELDIAIFKVFQKYDPDKRIKDKETGELKPIKFSTVLTWWVRSYCHSNISKNTSKKNDSSAFKMQNLDMVFGDGKGEGERSVQEMVEDESSNIEANYDDKDFLEYLNRRLWKVEQDLLQVALGNKRAIDLAEELGVSKQRISNQQADFKKRLYDVIKSYNDDKIIIKDVDESYYYTDVELHSAEQIGFDF